MTSRPVRVLTIGHSYVVGLNQRVPGAVAIDPRIDLTLAAPSYHHGDLRRLFLEKRTDPHYRIVALDTRLTVRNHVFWYDHRALTHLVRDGEFDVVHAWEEPYSYAGYQIARALGNTDARFVFRTAQSMSKRYIWPFSRFERVTTRRADAWVAGGQLVYDTMVSRGFPAKAGRVISLGVDTQVFKPIPSQERDEVRTTLGLKAPIVGFLGRLVEAKGLDLLMSALESVSEPWSLLALGSGPYGEKLEAWAARRGWSDRVLVKLVSHDEVPRYLASIDLLAAPSQTTAHWKEQFGRMIVEAFACGVPVVGSDSGEIPFVIADAGITVGEQDIDGWAETLTRLLSDDALRKELGVRGRERATTVFDTQAVAEQWRDLYLTLAETR
jgi:glycosyltransferase involved in cell wall biosynthesis